MKKSELFLFFLCLFFLQVSSIYAQDGTEEEEEIEKEAVDYASITTIFQKITEYDEVILETNLDTLRLNKRSNEAIPATFSLKTEGKESISIKMKIEPRGRFRRRICEMPPIKLDFPKKKLKKLGLFNGADKLKLVTHCQENEFSEQVLTKEYWTYKLYNELTDNSFRVHPIKITYIHSENPDERMESLAFIIESNEEIAYRLNGEIVEEWGVTPDKITKESYQNTLIFQYMVGNADWGISNMRNVKLIRKKGEDLLTVVPYDFDYSAVVKAPYARLNVDYGQTSLEQRVIQGKFTSTDELAETAKRFLALKDTGFECYKACDILTGNEKRRISQYLDTFFRFMKSEKKREAVFIDME